MFHLYHFAILVTLSLLCDVTSTEQTRRLTAIPRRSNLRRKSLSLEPTLHKQTLYYLDEYHAESPGTPLAASITLLPKLPTVNLDDVYEYIKKVTCHSNEGQMKLYFESQDVASKALDMWTKESEFLLLNSYEACLADGAHSAHIVSQPILNVSSKSILFKAKKTTFRSASYRYTIDIGDHILSSVDITSRYRRRSAMPQIDETTTAPVPTTTDNVQIASSSLTVSFGYPTPTTATNSSASSMDIAFSFMNETIVPPNDELASLLTTIFPLPNDVTLKCLNCTMGGSISFEAAGFSVISDPDIYDESQAISDFFDDGFIQFSATDVTANMSFELAFLPGFKVPVFTASLPDIPLGAFAIPEVLTFGPVLQFTFPIAVTLNSPVTLQSGFLLDVPSNSSMLLNVSSISSSTSQGFQDSKLTPLPFNANVEDLSLNFSIGFQPKIVVGVALFDDISSGNGGSNDSEDGGDSPLYANGGIGTYLDLPQLVATVSLLDNTDDHCNPSGSSTNQTYIHIEPAANLGAGVQWNLNVGALGETYQRAGGTPLYETSYGLPTQCLKWDPHAGHLVSATPTGSSSGVANLAIKITSKHIWVSLLSLFASSSLTML